MNPPRRFLIWFYLFMGHYKTLYKHYKNAALINWKYSVYSSTTQCMSAFYVYIYMYTHISAHTYTITYFVCSHRCTKKAKRERCFQRDENAALRLCCLVPWLDDGLKSLWRFIWQAVQTFPLGDLSFLLLCPWWGQWFKTRECLLAVVVLIARIVNVSQ